LINTRLLWLSGALSLTAHLFLLLLSAQQPEWGATHRPVKAVQAHTLMVRQLQAPASSLTTATSAPPTITPTTTEPQTPPASSLANVASNLVAGSPLSGDQDETFIPRPQLSIPPTAQTPIMLPDMDAQTPNGRFAGILALYIDETGRVHHITPLAPRLPPELEKAAIETFMAVQFTPGELRGAMVKSRIKVEVVFEKSPIAAPVPFQ
jgi:hypothetical protein